MLFYSGEKYFIIYDAMNDVADFVLNIIRILMKFAQNYQEHLKIPRMSDAKYGSTFWVTDAFWVNKPKILSNHFEF